MTPKKHTNNLTRKIKVEKISFKNFCYKIFFSDKFIDFKRKTSMRIHVNILNENVLRPHYPNHCLYLKVIFLLIS